MIIDLARLNTPTRHIIKKTRQLLEILNKFRQICDDLLTL
jgi:hypothetical protein